MNPPLETLSHVQFAIGNGPDDEDFVGIIDPVSREEWPQFRDAVNRQARTNDFEGVARPFSFHDMLIRGTVCFLNHYKNFEAVSFPMAFRMGRGTYCSPAKTVSRFENTTQVVKLLLPIQRNTPDGVFGAN